MRIGCTKNLTGGLPGLVCGAGSGGGTEETLVYESPRCETENATRESSTAELRSSGIFGIHAGEEVKITTLQFA